MEIVGDSLDDLLVDLYPALLSKPVKNYGRRGETSEIVGVALKLQKPRARISRSENRGKLFSALGELLWHLSGSDNLDFIKKYLPVYSQEATAGVIRGAYGPRLLRMRGKINQIQNVCKLLNTNPGSRRAVIQLFNAEDIVSDYKEIPCTTTLQFLVRENRLHLSVTLRSNDAYLGLPHDIFCFTMLQEMMACRLNVDLGCYYQYVGSMHIYECHQSRARAYLAEGHQRVIEMPPMPAGDPFALVPCLLEAEKRLRYGQKVSASDMISIGYWSDIIRLLQVYWRSDDSDFLNELKRGFCDPIYLPYLEARQGMMPPPACESTLSRFVRQSRLAYSGIKRLMRWER